MSDSGMFCIVSDESGHRWICPLSKRKEVEDSIKAVEEYWEKGNYDEECPEALTEKLNLYQWEGEDLIFSNPHIENTPL